MANSWQFWACVGKTCYLFCRKDCQHFTTIFLIWSSAKTLQISKTDCKSNIRLETSISTQPRSNPPTVVTRAFHITIRMPGLIVQSPELLRAELPQRFVGQDGVARSMFSDEQVAEFRKVQPPVLQASSVASWSLQFNTFSALHLNIWVLTHLPPHLSKVAIDLLAR